MNLLFKYFQLSSLSMSGALVLCIVFAGNPELAEGTFAGKIFWFHFSILLLAMSVLFMEITTPRNSFTFSLPDGLLLLFTGLIFITYNRSVDPRPEGILFLGQTITLWFMLRAILQTHPELKILFISVIICTGIIEAVWGIGHSHAGPVANHPLFVADGLIFNRISFAGYLAVILPMCFNLFLRFRDCDKTAFWEPRSILFYLALLAMVFILIALIIGKSNPAWLAASISCCWVFFLRRSGWKLLKQKVIRHNKIAIAGSIALFVLIAGLPALHNLLDSGKSANRTLMWNVATLAILNQPVTGAGLGSFQTSYARAQAKYFETAEASDTERRVAGSPKYAYNDYLQAGVECGVAGLLFFTLWIGFCLYCGIKNRQIGSTGAIISLLFFAMYSYPLQLPSFWVLLIFFAAMCITRPVQARSAGKSVPHMGAIAAIIACVLFYGQYRYYKPYKEWKLIQTLEERNSAEVAAQGYVCLYPYLSHQVEFLNEGACCLFKCKQYANAIHWSHRALQLCADPQFYYILADSYERLSLYKQSEKYLLQCLHIQPQKIETHYRLTKLYSKTNYQQPEKFRLAAHSVLAIHPDTSTRNIRLMKEEVYRLLQEKMKNAK